MKRRWKLSLFLFLVLAPLTVGATEPVTQVEDETRKPDLHDPITLDFSLNRFRCPTYDYDLVESVTMRKLPAGSLYVGYDGLQSVVVRHLRSQYRRFTRKAARAGWLVQQDEDGPFRALYERLDHEAVNPGSNGCWWQRQWFESLPEDQGGAPTVPYVHTYGQETAWKFGPFSVTNTLKVQFDYFAFFEVNPEPISHDHARKSPRVAFDLRPVEGTSFGTYFQFDVKPRVRIGMPTSGDPMSALRGLSVQASFQVKQQRRKVLVGEAEIKWAPQEGLIVTLEVALASW